MEVRQNVRHINTQTHIILLKDVIDFYHPLRSMHYPPETSSIMLMARMVAVVKQVSLESFLAPHLLNANYFELRKT